MGTENEFLSKWSGSAGNERANKDSFLNDLCDFLDVPRPGPKDKSPDYCFEKDVERFGIIDSGKSTVSIDFYKKGSFAWEAKQGSLKAVPGSAPGRGTRAYQQYMEKAFRQAMGYRRDLDKAVPFVITCDIGFSIQVWECFDGATPGYGARESFSLDDLLKQDVRDYLRAIFLDPESLSPSRRRAKVTRKVAAQLGNLASVLEETHPPEVVAKFLMRCVFTLFAEDISLLPEKLFEHALLDDWAPHPEAFVEGLEELWGKMNEPDPAKRKWGSRRIPYFNGGLFAESTVLPLAQEQIQILGEAAKSNWADVDPSIFGTLLESALNPEERHRLGAHYTPRAFIERLLVPALKDPLQHDWDLAQAEALAVVGSDPTEADKAKGRAILHAFHAKLAKTTVLDPACGSGNFLYVAYDILKRIEQEVLSRLMDMGETRRTLALDTVMVTPAQFHGIELKPWAASIAELVLWIGHLQWYHKLFPGQAPPEPILQRHETIECRDAVLASGKTRNTGRTRWDGKTFKTHSVTSNEVPDETAQVPIVDLIDPKPALWPEADFIVGNPPFLGNKRMRDALGDGYTEALRATYPVVPDSVDFVLYWWHKAAEAVRSGRTRRFGLITTNALSQSFNRRVIAHHTTGKQPVKLLWAIPDHPWADDGAAVRIAMTVGGLNGQPWLGGVTGEGRAGTPEEEAEAVLVSGRSVDEINQDLTAGADVAQAIALQANSRIGGRGMIPHGGGFLIDSKKAEMPSFSPLSKPYCNGRDLADVPRGVLVIDTFGLDEQALRDRHPACYQHLLETVKPERDQNPRKARRERWWLFAENQPRLRAALVGLTRYIATSYTSKHRVFQFLDAKVLPDDMIVALAIEDSFHLGVLNSRLHGIWAKQAGTRLGVGNDLRYNNSRCFDPFPFPEAIEPQKAVIRDLAERLDAHRKAAQGRGATITGMYNLMVMLRSGGAFNDREREQHEVAQTEILRQLHDELDAAVADAYGWTVDLSDADTLVNLVALNKERLAEEARGLVRWLRPEYQAPKTAETTPVPMIEVEYEPEAAVSVPAAKVVTGAWPKETKEQIAAVRDLVLASDRTWTLEDLGKAFKSRGGYKKTVEAHVDLLVDLGVVVMQEGPKGTFYHRPMAAMKAS